MKRILFVCLGNICRSPTLEGVMRTMLIAHGLSNIEVDSCGTAGYHIGSPPHPQSISHAKARGYDISSLRARRLTKSDFEEFDKILVMDESNLRDVNRLCPLMHRGKVELFTSLIAGQRYSEVPDPWGKDAADFELVLDIAEEGCRLLIEELLQREEPK